MRGPVLVVLAEILKFENMALVGVAQWIEHGLRTKDVGNRPAWFQKL